jgi:membrane-associated phospholipid phosphatase
MIYPMLGVWVILESSPSYINTQAIWFTLALVLTGTYIFPLLISFGLHKMGLIKTLEMHSRRERRLPYLVGAACYYVTALFLRQLPLPQEAFLYLMAAALIILLHVLSFSFFKPSAHLASIAGFTALLVSISAHQHLALLPYISLSVLVAGFVGSARLFLKAHTPVEVALGYLSGLLVVSFSLWMI